MLGTSIGMIERHYSHLTTTLTANELAGKRHPDRTRTELKALEVPSTKNKKKKKKVK
jgi:hypothetical protein